MSNSFLATHNAQSGSDRVLVY